MKTNIVIDISSTHLTKFWILSYGPKCCQPIKLQDSLKCNIVRKRWMVKYIFCMQINIEVFCKVILSFWVSVTRHAQSTQNKFAYLCNISIKAWGMKLIFCLQINPKVFYRMIVSFWVCVARQVQSTKNNQFTRSLQYLKEYMKDEVDFLPTDKCWSFFQIDTIILGVCWKACPNYLK